MSNPTHAVLGVLLAVTVGCGSAAEPVLIPDGGDVFTGTDDMLSDSADAGLFVDDTTVSDGRLSDVTPDLEPELAPPPDALADDVADATDLDATAPDAGPPGCNGAPALCQRRYDEVAYLTTHNAMSSADDGWAFPNQSHDVPTQLADGVRALMLDTHVWNDGVYLCHSICEVGNQLLTDGLAEIGAFLDAHPREVVTIIFESYISAGQAEAAFAASGLLDQVHSQPLGEPWPTLAEMIAADRRLVVFTDRDGWTLPWYQDVWAHTWETDWSVDPGEAFDCVKNRGSYDNELLILNHFVTGAWGALDTLAAEANAYDVLWAHAQDCVTAEGRSPNFVTLDFYDLGDGRAVVDALNAASSLRDEE